MFLSLTRDVEIDMDPGTLGDRWKDAFRLFFLMRDPYLTIATTPTPTPTADAKAMP